MVLLTTVDLQQELPPKHAQTFIYYSEEFNELPHCHTHPIQDIVTLLPVVSRLYTSLGMVDKNG